ncbi:MAG: hypothetical protein FWH14_08575 [Oscillospiraceae bacterium]|nr:hypothetical protein [Oscillospiraceae bacterium]
MANTRNKVAIVFDGVVCRVRTPVRTGIITNFVGVLASPFGRGGTL